MKPIDALYEKLSEAIANGDALTEKEMRKAIEQLHHAESRSSLATLEASLPAPTPEPLDPDDDPQHVMSWAYRRIAFKRKVKAFLHTHWVAVLLGMCLLGACGFIGYKYTDVGLVEFEAYSNCITRQIVMDQTNRSMWQRYGMTDDGKSLDPQATLTAIRMHSLKVATETCPASWGLHHATDGADGVVDVMKLHRLGRDLRGE